MCWSTVSSMYPSYISTKYSILGYMWQATIYDGQSRAFYWTWKEWWPSEPSFRTIDFAYIAALDEMKLSTKRERERARERRGWRKKKEPCRNTLNSFFSFCISCVTPCLDNIRAHFIICHVRVNICCRSSYSPNFENRIEKFAYAYIA